jgi:hypothetical protein
MTSDNKTPTWSFLTNHAGVLLCIANDPSIRLREIGDRIGITERAAHRIGGGIGDAGYIHRPTHRRVATLPDAGYIKRQRNGRRNHYEIQTQLPLPDSLARGKRVDDLLAILAGQT